MNVERCEVWWARPAAARPQLTTLLSGEERIRHDRLRRPADRDRYLVGHVLLRVLLGRRLAVAPAEVALAGGDGKPRLAGPRPRHEFSLSHSGERVVVAVAGDTPVGVDVEAVRSDRDLERLTERVLSPPERSALAGLAGAARDEAFYRYWVRKEAAVKATGDGLRMPFAEITVSGPGEPARLVGWAANGTAPPAIRLLDLDPGEGHVGCLATLGGAPPAVEEHDGTELLARIGG